MHSSTGLEHSRAGLERSGSGSYALLKRIVGFINQGYELVKQDASFIPSSFSVEEMGKDVTLLNQMRTILTRFGRLSQKMRDTYFLVGSEAYKASLIVYDNGKANAGPDVAPIIASMGELFQRAKKEADTTAASSANSGG